MPYWTKNYKYFLGWLLCKLFKVMPGPYRAWLYNSTRHTLRSGQGIAIWVRYLRAYRRYYIA